MIKMSTLYKKNPKNLGLVINEINPDVHCRTGSLESHVI